MILFNKAAHKDPKSNFAMCPISLTIAFGLLTEGLKGSSRQECLETFGFDKDDVLPQNFLDNLKNSLDGEGTTLTIANSLWKSNTLTFTPNTNFEEIADSKYKSEILEADLTSMDTVKKINSWVDAKTSGLITDAISEPFDSLVAIFLLNTVYFKGKWESCFDKSKTTNADFNLDNGDVVKTDFLVKPLADGFKYLGCDNNSSYNMIPYKGGKVGFVTFLPPKGECPLETVDLEKVLSVADINSKIKVNFTMPKFELESKAALVEILKDNGCASIFKNYQDFIGIIEEGAIVGDVIHKTKIKVDEEGTEAAGMTGISIRTKSMPVSRKHKLDRPFSFYIVDLENKVILFSGVYRKPE